jgi:Eco57I restriction-modification methylase
MSLTAISITVCDVACGSGHILLNAARRIATELAIVRTGEEQPSPKALREAVRDVIRHCVYGVDLNPMAVELCKVALWLESHNPNAPLGFLDHHIKCGNAIVGLAHADELERGIPDEAFKRLPDDDKDVCAMLRKNNKKQRKDREKGQKIDYGEQVGRDLRKVLDAFKSVDVMPGAAMLGTQHLGQGIQPFMDVLEILAQS